MKMIKHYNITFSSSTKMNMTCKEKPPEVKKKQNHNKTMLVTLWRNFLPWNTLACCNIYYISQKSLHCHVYYITSHLSYMIMDGIAASFIV